MWTQIRLLLQEQSDLGSPCLLLYLDLLVMLGNYLQQTTSADVIFQMHFFLGALGVNEELPTKRPNTVIMKSCPQKLLEKKIKENDNISMDKLVGSVLKLYTRWHVISNNVAF